jgi:single-strand DNA-binding protein
MMNSVNLIGRLTKNVELNTYKNSKGEKNTYCYFNLAVQRDKENCDFISCVAFGRIAEVLEEYTTKGTMIGISGSIQTSVKDEKYYTNVVVNSMTLCGGLKQEDEEEKPRPKKSYKKINNKELPF